ncbi:hypothetical protein LTR95_009767 [Oleoguttula sp. CCFEE 5521]
MLEAADIFDDDPQENAAYFRARVQDHTLLSGPRYSEKLGTPDFPITPRHGVRALAVPSTGPDRLTDLPPELLLDVLTFLPIRRIIQLRQVSRCFMRIIDGSEASLTRHGISYNRGPLNFRIKWLTDFQGLDLLDIVERYQAYYGPIDDMFDQKASSVLRQSLCEAARGYATVNVVAGRIRRQWEVVDFAMVLAARRADPACRWRPWKCANGATDIRLAYLKEYLQRSTFEVQAGERLELQVRDKEPFGGRGYTVINGLPKHFLTWRKSLYLLQLPDTFDHCALEMFCDIFDLPPVEECKLSYCIKTKEMAQLVRDATARERDLAASLFRQAAVLEELFIW